LVCRAGIPACWFWRLFRLRGAPKRRSGAPAASRQFNTGQECLRYDVITCHVFFHLIQINPAFFAAGEHNGKAVAKRMLER
jgi:hypothetical protein